MSETKKILDELKKQRSETKNLDYPKNDARIDFYRYLNTILYRYFSGIAYLELMEEIFVKRLINPYDLKGKEQFDHLLDNIDKEKRKSSYADITRQLILDVWTIFELTLTTILFKIYSKEEIESWLNKDYNTIMKLVKESNLNDENIDKIGKLLEVNQIRKKHLSQYPIPRRIDKLYGKISKEYPPERNTKRDKEFLKFLSRYRNCLIHLNLVYFGNNFEYTFKGEKFNFINEKQVIQPKIHMEYEIFLEVKSIFKAIEESLRSYEIIACIDEN